MINYTAIENTLIRLDSEYNASLADPDMPVLFSKLAIIELAGWLEDSLDDILFEYMSRHLIDSDVIRDVREDIIKKNYGFKFQQNIQKIYLAVLGANNWENIIDKINTADFLNFKSITGSLASSRNNAAHSSTIVTRTFNAPSTTLSEFRKLKPAIQTIESEVLLL